MSSNIKIDRICEHCGNTFTAKTTRTKYCSHLCNSRAYKAKKRQQKIIKSNEEVKQILIKPIEQIKSKEILTVSDTAILLGLSKRSVYRLIDNGTIKAVNLSERMTRIKRSEIDKLLDTTTKETSPTTKSYKMEECYSLKQIIDKYKISSSTLYSLLKREKITKIQKGKFVYAPKVIIDKILG